MTARWCEGSTENEYAGRGGHWYDPKGIDAPKPVPACICTGRGACDHGSFYVADNDWRVCLRCGYAAPQGSQEVSDEAPM